MTLDPANVSPDVVALNPDLFGKRPPRGPGKRAVPVVQNGQPVEYAAPEYRYEHDLQTAVFSWANEHAANVPELAMMFAIPNGGHRNKATAAKLKMEGVKAGVPDIFLAVPRGKHAGLFIELKVGKNTLRDTQKGWCEQLLIYGYDVAVCRSLDAAQQKIMDYLNG